MTSALCDFCSEPDAAFRYPARNFIVYAVAGVIGESVGDWAACATCRGLVEAGDRAALLERSIRSLRAKHPGMEEAETALCARIAAFHDMFFAHRTGAAVPVVESGSRPSSCEPKRS